jgi:hypothetical protein
MVVVSIIGLRSVACFARLSALLFPSMPMCPGTHETSIVAPLFLSINSMAVLVNFCEMCWLGPGFAFIITLTDDVLSANRMIVGHSLLVSGVLCWKSIAASSPLSNASISVSYTSAHFPIPLFPNLLSIPFQCTVHPAPVQFSWSFCFIEPLVYVMMYPFSCDICLILAQCSSATSPFVRPQLAGFVIILVMYCFSFASFLQGRIVCDGVIFSIFTGISLVISCIVDSLNLFGMPGLLLVGFVGRNGGFVVCLLFSLRSWVGSQLYMGFVGSILTANHAAACCFM